MNVFYKNDGAGIKERVKNVPKLRLSITMYTMSLWKNCIQIFGNYVELYLYFFLLIDNYDLLKYCKIYPENVLITFSRSNRQRNENVHPSSTSAQ